LLLFVACGSPTSGKQCADCGNGKADGDGSGDAATSFMPAPHRLLPQLTFAGGGLIPSMKLVVISAQNDPLEQQLFQFGNELVQGTWYQQAVGEYGVGSATTSVAAEGAALAPNTVLTMAQLQDYVTTTIGARNDAIPDGHTFYLVFLPPQVSLAGVPNNACNGHGGSHRAFGQLGDGWAQVQRCEGGLDHITTVASHEVVEGVTDTDLKGWAVRRAPGTPPWTGSVWTTYEGGEEAPNLENGDLCAQTHVREGSFLYQRSFSNAAATMPGDPCVPALPLPYYNTGSSADWFAGTPGQQATITLTGWSTAPTEDWAVQVTRASSSDPATPLVSSVHSATTMQAGGNEYPMINNAGTAELDIDVPTDAVSGWWVSVFVYSFHVNADGSRVPNEDWAHQTMMGVYVP
jgi:hypothetical protein